MTSDLIAASSRLGPKEKPTNYVPPTANEVDDFDRNDPKALDARVRQEIVREVAEGKLPRDILKEMNLEGSFSINSSFTQPSPADEYEDYKDERM